MKIFKNSLSGKFVLLVFLLYMGNLSCLKAIDDNLYKVLIIKGKANWVNKANKKKIFPVWNGLRVTEGLRLIVSPESVCLLLKTDMSSYMEISNATQATTEIYVEDLLKQWNTKAVILSSEYKVLSAYLLDKCIAYDGHKQDSCLVITSHSTRCAPHTRILIPNDKSYFEIYNKKLFIQWIEETPKPCPFTISISNYFGDELYIKSLGERGAWVSFDLGTEKRFLFRVRLPCSCCADSDETTVTLMEEENRINLKTKLSQLNQYDYWQALLEAIIYEDEKLFLDAFSQYKKIQKKFPNYVLTDQLYANFLRRNNVGTPYSRTAPWNKNCLDLKIAQ